MQHALGAILLGLLGGVIGAVGVGIFWQPAAPTDATASMGDAREVAALQQQLEDLQKDLEKRGLLSLRLEGAGDAEADVTHGAAAGDDVVTRAALTKQMNEVFEETLQPKIEAAVEEKFDELASRDDPAPEPRQRKKRMALADVAAEVGLSAGEEDALRQIYANSTDRFLKMMAGPEGDVEQVKQDFEAFRSDEKQRPTLMKKYVPRFITNVGEMMAIEADKETQVREAVGDEKADALDAFNIEEESPFDLGGSMRFEARGGR